MFAKGRVEIRRESVGLATIVQIGKEERPQLIPKEIWKKIRNLVEKEVLTVTSDIYRLSVTSQVREVKRSVEVVIKFEERNPKKVPGFGKTLPVPEITYLYWHEG